MAGSQHDRPLGPADFGLGHLKAALASAGLDARAVYSLDESLPPQAYQISFRAGELLIRGGDEAGALYGALDAAERVKDQGRGCAFEPGVQVPFIPNRGLKFNVPLDARTPSYSDCGDSALQNIPVMWEMDFWRDLLDRMALARYNTLTLWNLHPFPSLVKVPEYPQAALKDVALSAYPARGTSRALGFSTPKTLSNLVMVKRLSMEEKIAFWRGVMDYAALRCIKVYWFTWNIYLYGLEHTDYALTNDVRDEKTRDYYRRSVAALLQTYPRLAGIGVTAGENMGEAWTENQDLGWVRDTYGRGIEDALKNQPGRDFSLILRSHMTTHSQMESAFAGYPARVELSYKYSMARMFTLEKPAFGQEFFEALRPGQKVWLTLRNDDFYQLPWGDADFVDAYARNFPAHLMAGFYFGLDGLVPGLDFSSRHEAPRGRQYVDRHWFLFRLLGLASFQGGLRPGQAQALLEEQVPGLPAQTLLAAWSKASRALPLFHRVYWHPYDFQWHPEACCGYDEEEKLLVFHSLNHLINGRACPGSGYLSVSETALRLVSGQSAHPRDACVAAETMEALCREAREALGRLPAPATLLEEELLADISRMAQLGLYYAWKLRAAVGLAAHRAGAGESHLERAHQAARKAYGCFKAYAEATAQWQRPQHFSRLAALISPEAMLPRAFVDVLLTREASQNEPSNAGFRGV